MLASFLAIYYDTPMQIVPLPYHADTQRLFQALAHLPWAIWLDSGYPQTQAQLDIIAAEPVDSYLTWPGDKHSPFTWLREQLAGHTEVSAQTAAAMPGVLGYFGYECNRYLEKLAPSQADDTGLPIAALGFYPWVITVDHSTQSTTLVALPSVDTQAVLTLLKQSVSTHPFTLQQSFQTQMSDTEYFY